MTIMKLLFAIASIVIGISVACSASKSAGSQPIATNNAAPTSVQPTGVPAQEKPTCALTMAGAPDINGLKPGLTTDEVLALFPGSKDDVETRAAVSRPPSQFGVSGFTLRPAKFSNDKFSGVGHITFTVLDGRMSSFSVGYNGPEYPHVDKFVAKVIEGTNLPPVDQWQPFVGMDSQLKTLTCKDFEVKVFAGGEGGKLNYVLMQDLEADKTLKDRKKKAREKASPSP